MTAEMFFFLDSFSRSQIQGLYVNMVSEPQKF